eukprot:5441724-Amphidinium_carterae.1
MALEKQMLKSPFLERWHTELSWTSSSWLRWILLRLAEHAFETVPSDVYSAIESYAGSLQNTQQVED